LKKVHIAISSNNIEETIADYTARFGLAPCSSVPGEYALWRTEIMNFSVRQDAKCSPGALRHLGWEYAQATAFTQESDVNSIVWERFSAQQQADEINELWPDAHYNP